jgi:hypothetical protein
MGRQELLNYLHKRERDRKRDGEQRKPKEKPATSGQTARLLLPERTSLDRHRGGLFGFLNGLYFRGGPASS